MKRYCGWLLGAALVIAAAAGCSKPTTPLRSDQPPVTRVFLVGTLDTLNYRTRLHWSGDDPDGRVVGFEFQFQPGTGAPVDSAWHFTTQVDSIFALAIPNGLGSFTFWVRAVDNAGIRDPQPKSMYLHFRNGPPSVEFLNLPRRSDGTTYHFLPVVTLQWQGQDPEGVKTIRYYHLWLDGGSFDTLLSQSDTVFTLRVEHFGDVSTTRTRTVFLTARDEAAAVGDTVHYSWTVDAFSPGAPRVLLVDNYNPDPVFTRNDTPMDSLYRSACDQLTVGRYVTLDCFEVGNFRFPADATELFRHFDLVVWYDESGSTAPGRSALPTAETGLMNYLDGGGRLYLSDLSVVGQDHVLDEAFHAHYLGVGQLYCRNSSNCNYTLHSNQILRSGNPEAAGDSLATASGFAAGSDFYIPTDSTVTEFYLRYQDAQDDTTAAGYIKANHVGAVTRTVPSGGQTTFVSVPFYKLTQFGNRDAVLQRLFRQLVPGTHRAGWVGRR